MTPRFVRRRRGRTAIPAHDATTLRSASRKLALQFTALMVLVLVVVGALVYGIVWKSVQESRHQELAAALQVDSPRDVPAGLYLTYFDGGRDRGAAGPGRSPLVADQDLPQGLPDRTALARAVASGKPVESRVSAQGRNFTLLTQAGDGRVVQAAIDDHEGAEELGRLVAALAISGVLAALASAAASAWMARRAIGPLSEALELQRRFVADASHELRTPLTLLSTRAQLLRRHLARTSADQTTVDGVEDVVADSRMLTGILEDLLLAADPREPAPQAEVDLAELAGRVAQQMCTEARTRGLDLQRSGPPAGAVVLGVEVALQRMITALVDNAFGHARTRVGIQVEIVRGHPVLAVSDDGPGFPDGFSGHVFERFASSREHADPGRSAEPHYGLGLALVSEIAARHGAAVSIRPRSGARAAGAGGYIEVRFPR